MDQENTFENRSLLTGIPWKGILFFALPILLGSILQQLYNTADTIIVGNFCGENALSAVGTCMTLTNLYLAVAQGFSVGASVLVSRCYGAGDQERMRRTAANATSVLVVLSLLCMGISFLSTHFFLVGIIDIPENLLEMAQIYFAIYTLGFVFQFGYNIIAANLRSIGDSKASLYFLLVSSVVNILLDLLFVAVFRWGVAGAAIATILSQAASFAVSAWYMYRKYAFFRFQRREFLLDRALTGEILSTGWPIALQQMITSCGFMFIQRLVNSYGQAMTAAFTVARRIEAYFLAPTISIQNTVATYAAQNAGARNEKRTVEGLRQSIALSLGITLLFSVLIYLFAEPVISIFAISGQSMDYCVQYIQTAAISMLIFAFYYPFIGMYQGVGKGFFSSVDSSVVLGSRIVLAYAMSAVPAIGYRGIWLCEAGAWAIITVISLVYYRSGKWRKIFGNHTASAADAKTVPIKHAL